MNLFCLEGLGILFQWDKLQPRFTHNTLMYKKLTNLLAHSEDFETLQNILAEMLPARRNYSVKTFSFVATWHDDSDMLNRWRSYCMNNMASRMTKFGRNLIYIYHINVWSRIYQGGKDKIFIFNLDSERDSISLVHNCIYSESIKIRKFRASYVNEVWPLISRLLLLYFFFLNLEAWIWAFWILFSFRAENLKISLHLLLERILVERGLPWWDVGTFLTYS